MIWILKVTAVLTVLFVVSTFLRRATAAHRHLVWGVGLASLLAVPLVSSAVPWRVALLPAPPAASVDGLVAKPAKAKDAAMLPPAGIPFIVWPPIGPTMEDMKFIM